MPKKKINPMTQDQMLNIPYQFDMVPASKAVGPSASGQTEAQRVGRAMSKKSEADNDFEGYKEYRKSRPKIADESSVTELLNDRMNAASENLRTAKSQAGYKKGGMVRGCGMAARGHGKGRMC